jgi:hypothetical protein
MQRRIRAEPVPATIAGFASADEAIRASKQDQLLFLSSTGVASCFGQQIQDTTWSDDCIFIRLASEDVIRIGCDACGIVCEIAKPEHAINTALSVLENGEVELNFGEIIHNWDRRTLFQSLPGKILSNVQLSGPTLFISITGLPTICFGVMRNLDTGRLFLFWE